MMLMLWVPTNSFHLLEMFPMHRSKYRIVRFLNGCAVWTCSACLVVFITALISVTITRAFHLEQKSNQVDATKEELQLY